MNESCSRTDVVVDHLRRLAPEPPTVHRLGTGSMAVPESLPQIASDGDFAILPAGRHGVRVLADSRRDYPWDPVCVSPRLVPCTRAQIDGLHARRKAEWSAAVAAARMLPERPRMVASTFVGTAGFVRVGRSEQGQWWLVDAESRPFFYKGVCSVNRPGTQGGRRAKDGAYAVTVDAKYGYRESPAAFVEASLSRLSRWGFNALGSWTTEEFFEQGMFYTDNVEFLRGPAKLPRAGMVDVFDPAWRDAIDRKAREICAPQRRNRWLVGYFTENEDPVGLTPAERMVDTGSRAIRRLCGHPNVVGWTWYRWVADNPLRSPRNCGLVDERDEEHPWNVAALSLLHPHAEHDRLRTARAAPAPVGPIEGRLVVVLPRASVLEGKGQSYPQKVVFGVRFRDGMPEETVYGYGVAGRVRRAGGEAGSLWFEVELGFIDTLFRSGHGAARYRVTLTHDRDGHGTGSYEGESNGMSVAGRASAWRE